MHNPLTVTRHEAHNCPINTRESAMFKALIELRNATLAARERTGDTAISTRVDAGRVQLVRVTYPNGKRKPAHEAPIGEFMPPADAIKALNAL